MRTPVEDEDEKVAGLLDVAKQEARWFSRHTGYRRSYQDCYADCLLGVLEAVRTHRPDGGNTLQKWAACHARKRCVDGMRDDSPLSRSLAKSAMREPSQLSALAIDPPAPPRCQQDATDARDAVVALLLLLRPTPRSIG